MIRQQQLFVNQVKKTISKHQINQNDNSSQRLTNQFQKSFQSVSIHFHLMISDVKTRIVRAISPLHSIQQNVSDWQKQDQYDIHASKVRSKFKWRQTAYISQRSSPQRSTNSQSQPYIINDQSERKINDNSITKSGMISQSARNSPETERRNQNQIQQQSFNQSKNNISTKENLQSFAHMEMKIIKPYMYPKKFNQNYFY